MIFGEEDHGGFEVGKEDAIATTVLIYMRGGKADENSVLTKE